MNAFFIFHDRSAGELRRWWLAGTVLGVEVQGADDDP